MKTAEFLPTFEEVIEAHEKAPADYKNCTSWVAPRKAGRPEVRLQNKRDGDLNYWYYAGRFTA